MGCDCLFDMALRFGFVEKKGNNSSADDVEISRGIVNFLKWRESSIKRRACVLLCLKVVVRTLNDRKGRIREDVRSTGVGQIPVGLGDYTQDDSIWRHILEFV